MAGAPRIRLGKVKFRPYGAELTQQPDWYVCDFDYDALLVSQPHFRLRNGAWSGGGPFFTEHISVLHTGGVRIPKYRIYGNERGPNNLIGCGDAIVYRPPGYGAGAVTKTSRESAIAQLTTLQSDNYTRGILRTRPGRPEASIGQFLGELQDIPGLPGKDLWKALQGANLRNLPDHIRGRTIDFLGADGAELLNYEFGWKPLLRDFRDFHKLTVALNGKLAQLARESGQVLHRQSGLGHENTVTKEVDQLVLAPFWNVGGGSIIVGNGMTRLTKVRHTHEKRWFSAAYQYWINNPDSWLWKGKAVAALYGVLPTPELLYQITPWSWLIDWYASLADLAALYSPTAVDALNTLYAYTMRHRVTTVTWSATTHLEALDALPNHQWPDVPQRTFLSTYRVETKERGAGWAPFGLNLAGPTLTGKQQEILAALGTSRASSFRF